MGVLEVALLYFNFIFIKQQITGLGSSTKPRAPKVVKPELQLFYESTELLSLIFDEILLTEH